MYAVRICACYRLERVRDCPSEILEMPAQRDLRQVERQLAEALTDAGDKNGLIRRSPGCPSPKELRDFVKGRSKQPETVLEHIGGCPYCSQSLEKLRVRAARATGIIFAFAATAIVIVGAWLILLRPSKMPVGVATIDLRAAAPTRGLEGSTPVNAVRSNGAVRVLLPIGSEGAYECQIQPEWGGRPVLTASGQAAVRDHEVVLDLPVNLAQLPPGRYRLGLLRSRSDWTNYRLELK